MRKTMILAVLLMALAMAGCADRKENQGMAERKDSGGTVQSEGGILQDGGVIPQESTGAADWLETGEPEDDGILRWPEDRESSIIQEDGDYIYVCGTYKVLKIDKETKAAETLWENVGQAKKAKPYLYSEGSGLLLGDKLYFIEAWMEEEGREIKALSMIHTDGTGYQCIGAITDYNEYAESQDCMFLLDGILYVDTSAYTYGSGSEYRTFCYEVYEDGTLSGPIDIGDTKNNQGIPQGYSEAYLFMEHRRIYGAEGRKYLGGLLLESPENCLVRLCSGTGEEQVVLGEGYYLLTYNDKYFLAQTYGTEENRRLVLVDQETLEQKELMRYRYSVNVIGMDEDYVYFQDTDFTEGNHYSYEKVSLDTGERSEFFTQEEYALEYYAPQYLMDIVLLNGYFYYVGEKDYRFCLMRRSQLDPSEEEILGDPFYDSGIGEVGTMVSYFEKIVSKADPDSEAVEINLKWLQVDGRFPGADKINEYLEDHQNQNIAYAKGNLEWVDNLIGSEMEDDGYTSRSWPLSSYKSNFTEISYFDDHYLSFCQQEYDYEGGAHGMPIRIGYTFDLETGERLTLADVIGDSEEKLKEIAVAYFVEMLNEEFDEGYGESCEEYIRESMDFGAAFYLTEEGIVLYYTPYELASYADGFQEVVIPYREFTMKIPM